MKCGTCLCVSLIFLALALLFDIHAGQANQNSQDAYRLTVLKPIKYVEANAGEPCATAEFIILNSGYENINSLSYSSDCQCTLVAFEKTNLSPNEQTKVFMTVDLSRKHGLHKQEAYVTYKNMTSPNRIVAFFRCN